MPLTIKPSMPPHNWAEASSKLKLINKGKAKPKEGGLLDRLASIEKLMKEKK